MTGSVGLVPRAKPSLEPLGTLPHHPWCSLARLVVLNRTIRWCSQSQILIYRRHQIRDGSSCCCAGALDLSVVLFFSCFPRRRGNFGICGKSLHAIDSHGARISWMLLEAQTRHSQ